MKGIYKRKNSSEINIREIEFLYEIEKVASNSTIMLLKHDGRYMIGKLYHKN